MHYVRCNAHYQHFPLYRFFQNLENNKRAECALYGVVPHIYIDHYIFSEASELSDNLKRRNIRVETFIPHGYGYSLFAEQGTEHYSASLDYYKNCILAAEALSSKSVIIRPQNGLLSSNKESLLESCISMLKELITLAESKQICIVIGTSTPSASIALNCIEDLAQILDAVQSDRVEVYLDTYAMGTAGETIERWVNTFENRVRYVLLADGNYVGYRLIGMGVFPIEKYLDILREISYAGVVIHFLPSAYAEPEEADSVMFRLE